MEIGTLKLCLSLNSPINTIIVKANNYKIISTHIKLVANAAVNIETLQM